MRRVAIFTLAFAACLLVACLTSAAVKCVFWLHSVGVSDTAFTVGYCLLMAIIITVGKWKK